MITIVAALIEQNGRLLVCQRRRQDSFALKWEFPGGKLQSGETLARALERELEEELGVRARIGDEVYRTRHRYAEHSAELELIFFAAAISEEPRSLAFEQLLWAEPAALPQLDFLPADQELVRRLASGALRIPSAGDASAARREPAGIAKPCGQKRRLNR